MYWLDGRYDMDPIPLAEYCAQLQAAHDVNVLKGSLEDGENWYESSRWPALVDELQLIADVAPDEEEAEMWRVFADAQPKLLDFSITPEERSVYGDAQSELRERTVARCDMRLP